MPSSFFPPVQSVTAPSLSPTLATPRSGIEKKASEFEAMLLSQWLQSAQSTIGSAPGADGSEDADAQQWTGFAVQQLARAISDRGGIGIGKLVSSALHRSEHNANSTSAPENKVVSR